MSDFLLELGLEEIPARMIASAEAELGRRVTDLLIRERLLAPDAKITTYSTPRRLAVLAAGVLSGQADTEEKLTGPSWKVAFKDGTPPPPPMLSRRRPASAVDALEKVTTPGASSLAPLSSAWAAPRQRSWPPICPKKSSPSIGPRTCIGAQGSRSALSARYAGSSLFLTPLRST